jgi:hypothetical protein
MEYQSNIGQNGAAFTAGNPASGSGNRKPANAQQLVRENAQHLIQQLGVFHREALTVLLGSTCTASMENLKERHLPAIHTSISNRPQKQTDKEPFSLENYLLEFSERECESRGRGRIATAVRGSELPREKTMASLKLLPDAADVN